MGNAEYDFDRPEFASAVYKSLNVPTKLQLGLVNNAQLTYPDLQRKLIQAPELMQTTRTGCAARKQIEIPKEPIQAITFSNYGPHSQYKNNNQN